MRTKEGEGQIVAQPDPRDTLVGIGDAWGFLVFTGLVSVVIGILVMVWPKETLVVVAVLFGIQLVVGGAFRLVAAITLSDEAGGARVLIALLGLLSLLVGLFLLRHVLISLASLALVLGIFWIVHGLMESLAAIADRGARSRWLSLASGILGIVAGIVVFAYPKISLVALTWILGFWVVLFGLLQIAAGFHARALARGAAIAERR